MRASILLSIAVLCLGIASCQSSQKQAGPETATPEPVRPLTESANVTTVVPTAPEITMGEAKARPLTSSGDNTSPRFSSSGTLLIFVSRDRAAHRHAQVYELDLTRMLERRLTFHDGDDAGPEYFSEGRAFIYASSTDEAKEAPEFVENLKATYLGTRSKQNQGFGPSEIYVQTIDGREQDRLTDSSGYDNEVSLDAKGLNAVFTSTRAGSPNLFLLNLRGHTVTQLTKHDGHDAGARISADGKYLVWSRYSKDHTTAQLMLAPFAAKLGAVTELTKAGALDLHPVWHPSGKEVVFASNRGGQVFDLYSIDLEGKCLKRLTSNIGDKTQPAFSADGTKLAFTLAQNGKHQVYVIDYKPPQACLP